MRRAEVFPNFILGVAEVVATFEHSGIKFALDDAHLAAEVISHTRKQPPIRPAQTGVNIGGKICGIQRGKARRV